MRLRQRDRLVYGSTVLVIVDPRENHGHDVVTVIVGRKIIQRFGKCEHSVDKMASYGHIMVYVHDYSFFATTKHIKAPSKYCSKCRRGLTNASCAGYPLDRTSRCYPRRTTRVKRFGAERNHR